MGPALSRRSFLFDEERANIAGNLIAQTRPVRLSLGASRALPSPWRPRRKFTPPIVPGKISNSKCGSI